MLFWIPAANGSAPRASDPRIALLMCPRGGASLKGEILSFQREGVDGVVSMLTPDEELDFGLVGEGATVSAAGMKFWSFPIYDHGVPGSMEAMAALVQELRAELHRGAALGVHCWAGIGRSCLLLCCLLCAEGATPVEAFARVSSARGFDVPETAEQRRWVERFAAELH